MIVIEAMQKTGMDLPVNIKVGGRQMKKRIN